MISGDWSSDVCSSDLRKGRHPGMEKTVRGSKGNGFD